MMSTILWVVTVILVLSGGFFGFRRGGIKESIRIGIWALVFVAMCFLIPRMADRVVCFAAGMLELPTDVTGSEQLVSALLNQSDILQTETYLAAPLAGLLRSAVVPFLAIGCYWIAGLLSLVIYAVVMKLCKGKMEMRNLPISLTGLILGILLGLFGGAFTVYPVMQIDAVAQNYEELAVIPGAGSAQMLYRYTGTKWLAEKTHSGIVRRVTSAEGCNVWNQLPELMQQVMAEVIEPEELEETLSEVEQYLAETEDLTEKEKQEITEMISAVREGEVIDPIKYKELMQYAEEYLNKQE